MHIQHASIDGGSRVDVASLFVTSTEGQYLMTLDCSYVERRVTFYVKFMSGDCMSDMTMVITDECKLYLYPHAI